MDALAGLTQGFALLLSPPVLTACIIGLIAGLLAGFLPGISPLGGMALAIPFVGAIFVTFGPNSPAVFLVALAAASAALMVMARFAFLNEGPELVKRVFGPYSAGHQLVTWSATALGGLCGGCASSRSSLMMLIIEASVVLLPEPVGPVTRHRPRGLYSNSRTEGGRPMSSRRSSLVGICRKTRPKQGELICRAF